MFEKQKAKKIYKYLLKDLKEMSKMRQGSNECIEYESGSVVVAGRPNKKIFNHLKVLANKDGYTLSSDSFLWSTEDIYTVSYSITNESKVKRKTLTK